MATYSPFVAGQIWTATICNLLAGGWISVDGAGTFAYSSADAPTYVITAPADCTGFVGVGMRVQLTHGGVVKYFIITAIGAGTWTLYGGTDYTLSNTPLSLVSISPFKAPLGFNADPAKWSVVVTDSTQRSQATPNGALWYNVGSESITLPIGAWNVSYEVTVEVDQNSTTGTGQLISYVTLSNANNSESDPSMTCYSAPSLYVSANTLAISNAFTRGRPITVATKTPYYLNTKANAGAGASNVYYLNSVAQLVLRAVCAYL